MFTPPRRAADDFARCRDASLRHCRRFDAEAAPPPAMPPIAARRRAPRRRRLSPFAPSAQKMPLMLPLMPLVAA